MTFCGISRYGKQWLLAGNKSENSARCLRADKIVEGR
jgi:hypothetical protein